MIRVAIKGLIDQKNGWSQRSPGPLAVIEGLSSLVSAFCFKATTHISPLVRNINVTHLANYERMWCNKKLYTLFFASITLDQSGFHRIVTFVK